MKQMIAIVTVVIILLITIIGYACITETVGAGYVGYIYDRTAGEGDDVIPGTSVINVARTGLVWINPITQEVLKYPTTIIAKNWTRLEEGDNKEDMSMQVGTQEGKNIDADIYVSVKANDVEKIIKSFGTKNFEDIVENSIYGMIKGKLSIVAQKYSVYDIQSKRSEIQEEAFKLISESLTDTYGIELVRFEIGTLVLPEDIQTKIDQKTEAMNAVELAKLDREKQDEVNQKMVDEQEANSKVELIKRQNEADAAAYEIQKNAEAQLAAMDAEVKTAQQQLEIAKLNKEAELEKQKGYSEAYFRDKELDVQKSAVAAINGSVKTIITSGDGEGYSALIGINEILNNLSNDTK